MTIEKLIEKYNIKLAEQNGQEMITVNQAPKPAEVAFIKEHKAEIIELLKKQNAEREAKRIADEEARVEFVLVGWQTHRALIDTRKNINEQLQKIAENVAGDMITPEMVKTAYAEAIEKKTTAIDIVAEAEALETAKATGIKQIIKKYNAACNDPRYECTFDIITIYAMPDGTRIEKRTHTA